MSDSTQTEQQGFTMPSAGPEHKRLEPFAGTFRSEVKMWMGPGDPMITTGTMTNSWQLGGLYLQQEYVGDSSGGSFPSFVGKGYWGYNTTSKKYEGFWIDSGSTTMQLESGDVDSSGLVWTMHSELKCPQTGVLMKNPVAAASPAAIPPTVSRVVLMISPASLRKTVFVTVSPAPETNPKMIRTGMIQMIRKKVVKRSSCSG